MTPEGSTRSRLLGVLRFVAVGRGRVAGRETVTAEAVLRAVDLGRGPRSFELGELGGGADRYRLEVDAQRGVLLQVVALRDGQPFQKITTVEIKFDLPISEERFRFQPPAGEEIQPTRGRRPEPLSLREALVYVDELELIEASETTSRLPGRHHMCSATKEP